MSTSRPIDDGLLFTVARLYYEEGESQAEIAGLLSVSQAKVSRLLKMAKDCGIIRVNVVKFNARNNDLEFELKRRFGLRCFVVVKTPAKASAAQDRSMVGLAAASDVSELMRPNCIAGLAGGRALHRIVQWLKPEEADNVKVVQLMGNVESMASSFDAIELGRTLAKKCAGTFHALNAPAIVANAQTRDVFMQHEQILSVCNLYEDVDLALVGIGSLQDSVFVDRGVFSPKDLQHLRDRGAVGEICGRFFDRQGRECESEYRDRVIGIDLDQIRKIREVVGVTVGANRAEALLAALQGRLIKSLVTNQAGAEALLALDEDSK